MKKFLSVLLIAAVMCLSSPAFARDITATGMNQGDVYNLLNNLTSNTLNRSFGAGTLAIGSTTTSFKTASAIQYTIAGVFYNKTAQDSPVVTAAQQAAGTYCLYLLSVNSSGTIALTKGDARTTDTAVLPTLPVSSAPIGAIKIATAGATTFTFGTTVLSAAGITATYYNLGVMPSGPSRIGLTGW
jgi:hypothetical protein